MMKFFSYVAVIILSVIFSFFFFNSGEESHGTFIVKCDECNQSVEYDYDHSEGGVVFCTYGQASSKLPSETCCPICSYECGAYDFYDGLDDATPSGYFDCYLLDPNVAADFIYSRLSGTFSTAYLDNFFDELQEASYVDVLGYYESNFE